MGLRHCRISHARSGADLLRRELAVDLGTSALRVWQRGKGLVLDDLAVIAVDPRGNFVDAGRSAVDRVADNPDGLELLWPLRGGTVDRPDATQWFLGRMLKSHVKGAMRTRILGTVPASATPVERRALREALRRAGGSTVYLIEHPMAAALGCGLPVHEPVATMVVDVGAGVTEAAILSLGSVIVTNGERIGSGAVDERIANMLRREYGMIISARTAEEVKLLVSKADAAAAMSLIGSTRASESDQVIEARGRLAIDGSRVSALLERQEIHVVIDDQLNGILAAIRGALVKATPELAQDLIGRGMTLVGGGSQMAGLSQRISDELEVPVRMADDPTHAVVQGAGKCLEALDSLRHLFVAD